MVEISGGCITSIRTDRKMQIVIVDRDNYDPQENSKELVNLWDPDILGPSEKFSKSFGESIDNEDREIWKQLKSVNL
jgi:hypothetical protein